ncbi:MAG: pilus assembly protein PilP [Methylococcus sp.]|nr:pilus assembly protein PilP [Methylococcus sp.]
MLAWVLRLRRLTAAVTLSSIAACAEDEMADLKAYVAEVKERQKVSVEPLPEIKAAVPYLFKSDELHDPFKPFEKSGEAETSTADNGIRPDTSRPKELLEGYELDVLKMVGTVKMFGNLWALVLAADGTIHRVRVGNHMGLNFGRITRITEAAVELVEIVPDAQGGWLERNATMSLAETAGDKK